MLVDDGLAPALDLARRAGRRPRRRTSSTGGRRRARGELNTEAARDRAYAALVEAGAALPAPSEADVDRAFGQYVFFEVYREDSVAVTTAARETLDGIETRVGFYRFSTCRSTGSRSPRSTSSPPSGLPSPSASWGSSTWPMASSS
jgi:urea transport system permease protein